MIEIWHNILWSRYKGAVFSAIQRLASERHIDVRFVQIAKTEKGRIRLSDVDYSFHKYPYTLLFDDSYDNVNGFRVTKEVLLSTWRSDAKLTLIAGYNRPEYWAQLLLLIIMRKARGVFCDSTAMDRPYSVAKFLLKSFFFRQCDVIFCYGQRSKQYVQQHGVSADRIVFRCQAAALPEDYSPKTVLERRKSNVSGSPRFIYVGRFSPEKNLDLLIEAFANVRRSYPDATLRMIGDGPERSALEAKAATLGNMGVTWVGSLEGKELELEYLAASALVLPSLSEPWGLVVNEAMSYGCPVIVSERCGCVPELVLEGKTGFTINPFDVKDVTEKLERAVLYLSGEEIAQNCVNQIAEFFPQKAAEEILEGSEIALRFTGDATPPRLAM